MKGNQRAIQCWNQSCLWPRGFSTSISMKELSRLRGFSTSILTKELSATKGLFNLDLDKGIVCDQRAFQPRSWRKVIKGLFNLETGVVCDQGAFQHRSWRRNCLQLRGFSTSILTKEQSTTKGLFNLDLDNGIVCDQRGFSTLILTKELSVTEGAFQPRSWWKNCLGPKGLFNHDLDER